MNKLLTVIAVLVALSCPASAQNVLTFVPLGYCRLTSLATSALISTCSGGIPAGATMALISVEGAAIRYRDDGTAPTASDEWTRERIGPIADDVAVMDSRLAGYDIDGNVRTYSTEQLLAFTIKALQELKADNDNLRAEMRQRASR